jgi:DEAD/DEAH box helicase domain-containing protein
MTLVTSPIQDLLNDLADDGRLVHVEALPARAPIFAEPTRPLPTAILDRIGVDGLWTHQAEAIDLARSGQSVVIASGTGSGKSLCYQVPIAESVAATTAGTALALFPTKALAHDQLRSVGGFDFPAMVAATYDGDTPIEHRAWLRNNANFVLTNPEMLHSGVLPNHRRWSDFLSRLDYVVIDELHVLRGVFGTHVAQILRRLRRLAEAYGATPTFIFCSATIGQPDVLASTLCGHDVVAVTGDGAPKGRRQFALLNPPVVDEHSGVRSSSNSETAAAAAALVKAGHRTIVFCRSRKGAELVAADIRRRLSDDLASAVRSYRGGYLAAERREIEQEIADGAILAIVTTSALELGVDIGGLDACVLNGFPGTIASMWQQAGRAGRDHQPSVAVLVAGDDQLDQWLMAHPSEVFARSPEPAVINPANDFILDPHLACAAHELALSRDDERYWPGLLDDGVRRLVLGNRLRTRSDVDPSGPIAVWSGKGWPSRGISLRSGSSREVHIVTTNDDLIGTVDESRAHQTVHPGAVYLHRGENYEVIDLDLDELRATVEVGDGSTYTQARTDVDIAVTRTDRRCAVGAAGLSLGSVEVTSTVVGYDIRDTRTRKLRARKRLELPPQQLRTRAFWFSIGEDVLHAADLTPDSVPGSLHAAEHAGIGILPLFTICDRWDVGGVSTAHHPDVAASAIFIYDGYPGGAGIAELGYAAAERLLEAALDVIACCGCDDGCPSCVQSPKCGSGNDPLDKFGAARLIRTIIGST